MSTTSKLKTNLCIIAIIVLIASSCFIYVVSLTKDYSTNNISNDDLSSFDTDVQFEDSTIKKENILFETNDYVVIKNIKRSIRPFTQGLFMDTDYSLIESGGLYGESTLSRYNIDSPDDKIFNYNVPNNFFAEGACLFKDTIYQLTWRERKM